MFNDYGIFLMTYVRNSFHIDAFHRNFRSQLRLPPYNVCSV
jgi:hypothetical protein